MECIPKSNAKICLSDEEKTTMLKASEILQKMEDFFDEVTDNDATVSMGEWDFVSSFFCFTFTGMGEFCKDLGTLGEVSVW